MQPALTEEAEKGSQRVDFSEERLITIFQIDGGIVARAPRFPHKVSGEDTAEPKNRVGGRDSNPGHASEQSIRKADQPDKFEADLRAPTVASGRKYSFCYQTIPCSQVEAEFVTPGFSGPPLAFYDPGKAQAP
jgi:hypothetical protein